MTPSIPPIDLYGLRLLRLVAEHQGITAAAEAAGLTQSALTRQVQGMEQKLGVALFERTTRRLVITPAGETLLRETAAIPAQLEAAIRQVRENHLGVPRELRVGVSRSVSLSHLPGLLHAQLRQSPEVKLEVSHLAGTELLEAVAQTRMDAGILGTPRLLPPGCRISHRMADQFVMIAPAAFRDLPDSVTRPGQWTRALRQALGEAPWLMLSPSMQTRQDIDAWLRKCGVFPEKTSAFDSFDLIIHLAALGLGVSLVPRRAIVGFPRKSQLKIIPLPENFERELVVVTRLGGALPGQVKSFVASILFS